ncbi:tetratricopeptide repeat protein [Prosthecobacter sp.]|uniref:tetratricopeptide repeat protein n=1 Tax=Prosthecobacter sp. TaxID=1965333 RepID=UPI0037851BB2
MLFRVAFCLLVLCVPLSAQQPPQVVPAPAQRYWNILVKRPEPGTVFERFYAAWLEEGTVGELEQFLLVRAGRADASATDHLILAVLHAHRGDDPQALLSYQAALKLSPGNASAWIECSRIESRALDFKAALESLDHAEEAGAEDSQKVEIGRLRGRALLRLGKSEEALKVWKSLIAADADDEDLQEEIIDLLVDEGQLETALEAARALVLRSRDPLAKTMRQLRLADILLLAGRGDEALSALDAAFEATGADSWIEGDILARIDRLFRMKDDVSGLQKHLAMLTKAHPQRVALAWQHTLLLAATGQKNEALQSARALLQSSPGRRDLRDGFLDLLESVDLPKEAAEQAKLLVSQNPEDKDLRFRLAALQHRAGEDAAALATLESMGAPAGANEADLLRIARLLESWEELPAKADSPAAAAFLRLATSFPQSIAAQEARAQYLHRTGQREEALGIWRRLAKTAALEDLLRIAQGLQARTESRYALDVLHEREKDFATQPRFLALLVHQLIANEEHERALPLARAHLRLMQDADGIENSLKNLLVLLRCDETKLVPPLLNELQQQTSLTLQERCLFAAVLELSGKNSEAETVLSSAPAEDSLVALTRLSHLYQFRQDWTQALQTLQRVLALPGGRTSGTLQRMVELCRRALLPEEARKYIAEWKAVSPGAVAPWLTEARVLKDSFHEEAALKVLQLARRKFPDAAEVASACAQACLDAGQAEEAERIYLSLYEKTTDPVSRLRLLPVLAGAAQSHGGLRDLIQNFSQRQKQNRASAHPWLALAEIHRATGSDEEHRRCLYEASRLRPKDLGLLLEIARSEEAAGLTAEALRSLEAAAKLDKTTRTRVHMARLQIEEGNADAGYRMLFELAGGSQMDARAREQMADTIAEEGEWERVITFLEPALEKHSGDYRLHYLHGVALEEAGREKEAAGAFLRILGMDEELPGVVSTGGSIGTQDQRTKRHLPPDAERWLALPSMRQPAYAHRQNSRSRSHRSSSTFFGQPASAGVGPGFIEHASDVTVSHEFALVHLLQMVSGWDAQERAWLGQQMAQAGVDDAALLLEAAETSPQFIISPGMLANHPRNLTLHAMWLVQEQPGDPEEMLPLYENAWNLFQMSYPDLACRAAQRAMAVAGENSHLWQKRFLDLIQTMPQADVGTFYATLSMLRDPAGSNNETTAPRLGPEAIHQISGRLLKWYQARPEVVDGGILTSALVMAANWDAVVAAVKTTLQTPHPLPAPRTVFAPYGRPFNPGFNFQPQPLPMPPELGAGLNHLAFIPGMTTERDPTQDSQEPTEEIQRRLQEIRDGLRPHIDPEDDERVRIILRIICGEKAALEKTSAAILQKADATADECVTAAWLAQWNRKTAEALTHLSRALKLTTASQERLSIESAILYHTQLLVEEESDKARAAPALAQASTLLQARLQKTKIREEQDQIVRFMAGLGLNREAEAARAGQNRLSAAPPSSPPAVTNPYSRMRSTGQPRRQAPKTPAQLVKEGQGERVVNDIVRQLRAAIRQMVSSSDPTAQAPRVRQIIAQATELGLWGQVTETLRGSAGTGWRSHLENAVLLENDPKNPAAALAEHRVVVGMNPRAHFSQVRLAIQLTIDGHYAEAAEHWRSLPAPLQETMLPGLLRECSQHQNSATSISGLLCAWLKGVDSGQMLSASIIHLMEQALVNIQAGSRNTPPLYQPREGDDLTFALKHEWHTDGGKARAERRRAHDDLCRAMLQRPEAAAVAFGPFAGLIIQDGDPKQLAALEATAIDLLTRLDTPRVRSRLSAFGFPGDGQAWDQRALRLFGSADCIPMPDAALFLALNAARRGDSHALDETMPLITRVQGAQRAASLKGYARLLMVPEKEFPAAAAQWLQQQPVNDLYHEDSAHEEILRLWVKRKIDVSLDELFLPERPAAAGYKIPPAISAYVEALSRRHSDLLHGYVRKLRDRWLGQNEATRREAAARWLACLKDQGSRDKNHQPPPSEKALEAYAKWLQRLLQSRYCLGLFDLAVEDGLADSSEWLSPVIRHYSDQKEIVTPGDLLHFAHCVGFLGEGASFRPYLENENSRATWLGQTASSFREHSDEARINATLELISRCKPTLGMDLLQALLLKSRDTQLRLNGRPMPFPVGALPPDEYERGAALRSAALLFVLERHASEIKTLSEAGRRELSALLHEELQGYPYPGCLGEALTRSLAPLVDAENAELIRKAGRLLAIPSLMELSRREPHFVQSLEPLLREVARVAPDKACEVVRHVAGLIRAAPEAAQASSHGSGGGLVHELVMSLGQIPQLYSTVAGLADEAGIPHLHNWSGWMLFDFDKVVKDPSWGVSWFTATPFVADTEHFRDFSIDSPLCSSLIFHLVGSAENHPETKAAIIDHLKRQPATFGTDLVLALFEFDPESRPGSSPLEKFMLKHGSEFPRLHPGTATSLTALFKTLLPSLWEAKKTGPDLSKALRSLRDADARDFEDEISRWLAMKELGGLSIEIHETIRHAERLLDRLAQSDLPRATAFLDHMAQLFVQEEISKTRGAQVQVSADKTLVALWLQHSAAVPELFADVMRRATECGVVGNPSWRQAVLVRLTDVQHLLDQPARFLTRMEAAHVLDPAATFDPQSFPEEKEKPTLLEAWIPVLSHWPELKPFTASHRPKVFGADLIRLLAVTAPNEADIRAFAKAHADEIAACTPEQQKIIAALLRRLGFEKIASPHIPALKDEFGAGVKD